MRIETLRAHRYLILLLALLVGIVEGVLRAAFPYLREALLTALAALVFLIVFDEYTHRLITLVFGLLAVAAMWLLELAPPAVQPTIEVAIHLGVTVFFTLAVAVVLRNLFERRAVRIDDLLGTLCGYLMAAIAWANVYAIIELLHPAAFDITTPIKHALDTWHDRQSLFLYFSLTTLTTIGYGDIAPVAATARAAAVLEGVFGQFYVAVVVAQLVGSKLAEAGLRDTPPRS